MRLRHAAVFWYAGSYVINPKSSETVLILRRSVARIAPSWMGTSYWVPVRLSVIVSVSAISAQMLGLCFVVLVLVGCGNVGGRIDRIRDAVIALQPAAEIGHLAALAAEGPPLRVGRMQP